MQEGAFGMAKTMRDRKMINSIYNSLKDYIESKSDPELVENQAAEKS